LEAGLPGAAGGVSPPQEDGGSEEEVGSPLDVTLLLPPKPRPNCLELRPDSLPASLAALTEASSLNKPAVRLAKPLDDKTGCCGVAELLAALCRFSANTLAMCSISQ
jgi:hypothetical protein